MRSALARFLASVVAASPGLAGPNAAEQPGGIADLQQSIQRSATALRGEAAQIQAGQAQQRAEGAGAGGLGVQVTNPAAPPPLAPTTPPHCVTRYSGANVFTDCR